MRTPVRALLAAVVAILALATPAAAAVRHHAGIWQHHVRLVPLPGGGTSIHVGGRGSLRTVILSPEAIAAAAVRDIDADGDLDIIASGGHGLVVWRNLGAGRYALAAPPDEGKFSRRFGPGLSAFRSAGQTSGLGGNGAFWRISVQRNAGSVPSIACTTSSTVMSAAGRVSR